MHFRIGFIVKQSINFEVSRSVHNNHNAMQGIFGGGGDFFLVCVVFCLFVCFFNNVFAE